MIQNTNKEGLIKEQSYASKRIVSYQIEGIEEYLSRGGEIHKFKPKIKTHTCKSHKPVLLDTFHHRFPSAESLAIAKELRKLRAQEKRV